MSRHITATLLALLLVLLLPTAASATVAVTGTADYRAAPRLVDGTYTDTIVTGETVWYAVLYTNDAPYTFTVDLADVDLDAEDTELDLSASFIGPTLGAIGSGRELSGSASYTGGGTNLWYLAVELATEGRLGVAHDLVIEVEGVAASGFDDCTADPDCDLDTTVAELESRLAELETQLDEFDGEDSGTTVEEEVAQLEADIATAEADISAARDSIAELCGGSPCTELNEPAGAAGVVPLAIGALVLIGGLGLLGRELVARR